MEAEDKFTKLQDGTYEAEPESSWPSSYPKTALPVAQLRWPINSEQTTDKSTLELTLLHFFPAEGYYLRTTS